MVTITFEDRETEKRALAFLLGRFSGRVLRSGEHAGDVVDSETTANGCELLAVVSVEHHAAALELESAPGAALSLSGAALPLY